MTSWPCCRGGVTDKAAAAAAVAAAAVAAAVASAAAQLTLGKFSSHICRDLRLTCNCVNEY